MRLTSWIAVVAASAAGSATVDGQAAWARPRLEQYAIVVGHNGALPQSGREALAYADDDAVRNAALFEQLGATVSLLAELDDDTRATHPSIRVEGPPSLAGLRRAARSVNRRADADKRRGSFTVAYFLYSGHGGLQDGDGYLTLADGALSRHLFYEEVLGRLRVDRIHVLIDACEAAAMARGGDGASEEVPYFGAISPRRPAEVSHAGFLLPSTEPTTTYEWRRFRGGIFGHLVRSGLRGAADVDGDRRVSYREIDSFIAHAFSDLDEAYRPTVMSAPPADDDTLVYLESSSGVTLAVDRHHGDHLYVVGADETRHLDLRAGHQSFRILLPRADVPMYLVDVDEQVFYLLPTVGDHRCADVALSSLTSKPYETASGRGPSEQFARLFKTSFDHAAHLTLQTQMQSHAREQPLTQAFSRGWSRGVLWTLAASSATLAVGAAGLTGAGYVTYRDIGNAPNYAVEMERMRRGRAFYAAGYTLAASAVVTAAVTAVLYGLDDRCAGADAPAQ